MEEVDIKELYKKSLNPVPVKKHKGVVAKHIKAAPKAYEAVVGKTADNEHDMYEILADALIAHRKAAGIPVSEDKEDRHHIYTEVQTYFKHLQQRGKVDPKKMETDFALGDIHQYVSLLVEKEKNEHVLGKPKYEISNLLKNLKAKKRIEFARHMAAQDQDREYSTGEINSMAAPGNLEELMAGKYIMGIENQIKKGKHKDEEEELKKAA